MTAGAFVRQTSQFRGQPKGGPERHHLYVSLACPWSQRTVLTRAVLGLDATLTISYADPFRDERGWRFTGGKFSDQLNGFEFLSEAYRKSDPSYDAHVSVPVLWDKQDGVIVSNESADIIRIFDDWTGNTLRPPHLADEIEQVNAWTYRDFQNGVYRAGFSRSQRAYDQAFKDVFDALAKMEQRLETRRYLVADQITETDWRVLPTLLRFDAVYHTHFRCNGARLIEYPNLLRYTRDLFHQPKVEATFALDEIKRHYYTTHDELNPKRIIPAGPLDLGFTSA